MFPYACPFCAQSLLAPPERAGQRTICPKCLRPLTIPDPALDDDPDIDLDAPPPVAVGARAEELSLSEALTPPPIDLTPVPPPAEATPPPPRGPRPVFPPVAAAVPPRSWPRNASHDTPVPAPVTPPTRPPVAPLGAPPLGTVPTGPRPTTSRLPRHETGMVSLNPTGLNGVDLGAELTAALTMRMKPPPDPPADLALSTGGWLLMCAAAAGIWVAGVFYHPQFLPFVAVIGALMLAFGFLWAAYLVGRQNPARGLVTLLPPVALWRIFLPFGDNGHRPLRFALTGALCLVVAWLGYPANRELQSLYAEFEFERKDAPPSRPTVAQRLRTAADAKDYEGLSDEVFNVGLPEYRDEVTAEERPALVALLKGLTRPENCPRGDVRARAVVALMDWSPEDAREAVLRSLRSAELPERRHALLMAPRWSDDEVALAVARRLTSRAEESAARDALAKMAPAAAETGLLPMLRTDDESATLSVAEMLERVGGSRSVEALTALSQATANATVREELARRAETIRKRVAAGTTRP